MASSTPPWFAGRPPRSWGATRSPGRGRGPRRPFSLGELRSTLLCTVPPPRLPSLSLSPASFLHMSSILLKTDYIFRQTSQKGNPARYGTPCALPNTRVGASSLKPLLFLSRAAACGPASFKENLLRVRHHFKPLQIDLILWGNFLPHSRLLG